jgi:branched-chain amino acid transport system permease protein
MGGSYIADLANQITFLVALAVSLNLLLGFAGQMSMATAAFYGLGAYTCAIMTAQGMTLTGAAVIGPGWPFLGGLASAIVVSFVGGLVVAAPAARRVRGDYLILLTLAFHFLFVTIASSWVGLTGGPNGIVVPPIGFFGYEINTTDQAFWFLLAWAAFVSLVCWWIGRSPFGRLLRGIREDEIAIQALGKRTIAPKSLAFAMTAAMAGATGAISAAYMQFVAPTTYSLDLAILVAACVALGGPGNILGSVVAAIVIGALRPILENVPSLSSDSAVPWQTVIYGSILVAGMVFRPRGLLPEGLIAMRRFPREAISAVPRVVQATLLKTVGERDQPALAKSSVPNPMIASPIVRVRNLSKSFGGLQAVKDVSFDLHPGEIVALIGPNGAGKSTIFNLMTGAIRPDQGEVTLHGQSLAGADPCAVARSGMARYFQHVRILPGLSALNNVAIGVPRQAGENLAMTFLAPMRVARGEAEVRAEALRQLENVGIAPHANRTAQDLAFGQQKLVAFARLLATGAQVLLLDEPTSGVDPQAADQIIALVRTLAQSGKSICIVEHSLHVVSELADRILFMNAGAIMAEGTVEAITTRPDLVDLYFGT